MPHALVTGANGHIGANLVRQLLDAGREVRAFVREGSDMRGLDGVDVEIVHGDVLDAASVEAATPGCEVIYHLAVPYKTRVKDPDEIMRPAIEGAQNVFSAAAKAGVRRVVYTSSVVSVGMSKHPETLRDESDWALDKGPAYNRAKTRSEREAYRLAEEHGVDLVVVCPGMVLGPLDYRITPSNQYLQDLLNGKGMTGRGAMTIVGVDDIARGHLLAAEKGKTGERYILTSEMVENRRLGEMVGDIWGKKPTHLGLPRWLALPAVALMNFGARLVGRQAAIPYGQAWIHVDRYAAYDTTRAKDELGFEPRPARPVVEEAASWLAYVGALKDDVAATVLEKFPADPSWSPALQ